MGGPSHGGPSHGALSGGAMDQLHGRHAQLGIRPVLAFPLQGQSLRTLHRLLPLAEDHMEPPKTIQNHWVVEENGRNHRSILFLLFHVNVSSELRESGRWPRSWCGSRENPPPGVVEVKDDTK